jgi:hypothetical protein
MTVSTIPASEYVALNPSVLSAGGNAPSMSGLFLDSGPRVPIGQVLSFPNLTAVGAYFGASSLQYTDAQMYFAGFTLKTQTPGAVLFAQYPTSAVSAWLRGGSLAAMTLAQLQALSGTITISIDGQSWTSSSVNLASATSFSNAASIIQTALAANDASFTASIAPASASLTGVLASGVLTASSVTGQIVPGATLTGSGVNANTTITSQLTGTPGGAGTYQTSGTQTVSSEAMTTANANAGVMTVSGSVTGALAVGQVVAGSGVTAGTQITGELGATGGAGEYIVTPSQTVSSVAMTAGATVVTFDSISQAFLITAGTPGASGAIAFPTTNSLTTGLALTAAAGAVTSQGAAAATPAAFMNALIQTTQNFASFAPNFEPVTADKIAFSQWTSGQNGKFAYALDSTDIALTTTDDSSTALAQIIAAGYSGTIPNYQPSYLHTAAFVMGMIASINYSAPNGRISFAYKASSLLTPGVTNVTVAQNLEANGCNYYGSVANPANNWNFYFPGKVTGPFQWADSYINQIWLNQSLQTGVMNMLTAVNSVPYVQVGYDLVSAACAPTIQQAISNGVITPGVALSAVQVLEVNQAAGANIAPILSTRGWYLQVGPATAAQRGSRSSPPCTLWYCDGGNINRINLAAILAQ